MRIALVHMRHGPVGGTEGYLNALSVHLADAGHDVTIVCRSRGQPGHPAIRFAVLRPFAPGRAARLWTFARAVERHVRHADYDIVVALGKTWTHDVIRLGGGCHATYLEQVRDRSLRARLGLPRLSDRVALRIEARALAPGASRRVIVNSRMAGRDAAARHGIPPDRLRVVYNGVDLERFHPRLRAGRGLELRAAARVAADLPVVLFLGSGFARKGLDLVLAALPRMRRRCHLLVAGTDSRQRAYEARARELGIADRVTFLGLRRDPETCYAAADVFVLPTRYDPFANATLEALASGLPVVTSASNGASELITGGVEGSVLARLAAEEVAAALDFWLCADRARHARAAARALAERHPSRRAARETEQVILEAAREKGVLPAR